MFVMSSCLRKLWVLQLGDAPQLSVPRRVLEAQRSGEYIKLPSCYIIIYSNNGGGFQQQRRYQKRDGEYTFLALYICEIPTSGLVMHGLHVWLYIYNAF